MKQLGDIMKTAADDISILKCLNSMLSVNFFKFENHLMAPVFLAVTKNGDTTYRGSYMQSLITPFCLELSSLPAVMS